MKRVIIYYCIVGIVSLALAYFLHLLRPVTLDKIETTLVIPSGYSLKEISHLLYQKNLIRSPFAFRWYAILSGSAWRLQAGGYFIQSSMSIPQIIGLLTTGPKEVELSISEGKTLVDIDALLAEFKIIQKGELVDYQWQWLKNSYEFLIAAKSLEGFLFPDTYRFYPASAVDVVMKKFLDNFTAKAWPLLKDCQISIDHCHGLNAYQILIMASLIEKEVPFDDDRFLVSGVLHRRLKIGMPLQVDAAPNTYKYYGLPPQPIANPGLMAIKAALNPKPSSYLYYLSDPKTKKTIFSKTLEEHNKNRWLYLQK